MWMKIGICLAASFAGLQAAPVQDHSIQVDIIQDQSPQKKGTSSTSYASSNNLASLEQIKNNILSTVQSSFQKYNIIVKLSADTVTLTGTVQSLHDKDRIERDIRRIRGVQKVDNQLQVAPLTRA